MSSIPRHADLRRLAAAGARLEGAVALAELERLQGVLADTEGSAQIDLLFGVDDEGYRCISGRVGAAPRMVCQRCLGPVTVVIDAEVGLAMVWREDEIPSLPSRFEGVVVGTEPTDLYELIEEEVLLALPLVPRHESGTCSAGGSADDGLAEQDEADASPLAIALRRSGLDKG